MDPERALFDLISLTASFFASTAELLQKYIEHKDSEPAPAKGKRKEKKRDKKPHKKSAYMLFSQHVMPEMKKQDEYKSTPHTGMPLSQLSKLIGAQWQSLPEDQKALWREKAAASLPPKDPDPALLSLLEEDTAPDRVKRPRSESLSVTESESET